MSSASSSSGSGSPPKPSGFHNWTHEKQETYRKQQKQKGKEAKKRADKNEAADELWNGVDSEGKEGADELENGWTVAWTDERALRRWNALPRDIKVQMYKLLGEGADIASRFKSCGFRGIYSFPMGDALSPPYRIHCLRDEDSKRIIIIWAGDHDTSNFIKTTSYKH